MQLVTPLHPLDPVERRTLTEWAKPIVIGDLWAITPGNGGAGGSANTLYFTAGVQNEAHGLFGSITPTPHTGYSVS